MSENKLSLDDFKRWKVPELKNICEIGILKQLEQRKNTGLAYGAEQCSAPLKATAKQEELDMTEQYRSLLHCLPDPFDIDEKYWDGEERGITKWPPIYQLQIAEFILSGKDGMTLGKRLLSDYKEGKAYSYFDAKWLKEIFYHDISPTHDLCFLKSTSTPSQKIGNVPHRIWVCVGKKTGSIESAYCTCLAG